MLFYRVMIMIDGYEVITKVPTLEWAREAKRNKQNACVISVAGGFEVIKPRGMCRVLKTLRELSQAEDFRKTCEEESALIAVVSESEIRINKLWQGAEFDDPGEKNSIPRKPRLKKMVKPERAAASDGRKRSRPELGTLCEIVCENCGGPYTFEYYDTMHKTCEYCRKENRERHARENKRAKKSSRKSSGKKLSGNMLAIGAFQWSFNPERTLGDIMVGKKGLVYTGNFKFSNLYDED